MKKLEQVNLIELEITFAQVKLKTSNRDAEPDPRNDANQDIDKDSDNSVHPRTGSVHPRTDNIPEPLPDKDPRTPQTLKTYSDFKRSLSEGERENFLIFVKEKTANLEKPINDLEAWLASKNAAKQNRWEIYYKNYQEEKKYEKFKTTKQNKGSENYDPQKIQDVIKRFQNRGRTDASEPKNEVENETKEIDREEIKRQQAEIARLMNNPPEYEDRKSPAQQRRDAISEAKRKREEWNLERKRLDAERQRQQELDEPDPEARTARMVREAEEFLRNRQQQQQNPEIGEEDKDYE